MAISELSDLYIGMRLWKQAINLIDTSEPDCTDRSTLEFIKAKIEKALKGILESAKVKINSDSIDKTLLNEARREIFEFQSVYPQDPEANWVFDKLKVFEKEYEIEPSTAFGSLYSPELCQNLEEKAQKSIRHGDYEKAIGIYEGFIRHFPERENTYRRVIGDLRFETGDYKSALWHYNKGHQQSPDDAKLFYRMRFAKPLVDASALQTGDNRIATTVIMLVDTSCEGLKEKINQVEQSLSVPAEVILLCQSNKGKHACLETTKPFSIHPKNINAIIEIGQNSVMSINSALKKAKGKTIILMDTAYYGNYKRIGSLIKRLDKHQTIGFAGPRISVEKSEEENKDNRVQQNFTTVMTNMHNPFFVCRKHVLEKIGLLDASFCTLEDACEDLRIRASL